MLSRGDVCLCPIQTLGQQPLQPLLAGKGGRGRSSELHVYMYLYERAFMRMSERQLRGLRVFLRIALLKIFSKTVKR